VGAGGTGVMEYLALDLETTGLDADRDRVIELGAVAFTTERVLATLQRLVNPGRGVPEAVLRLTGIDPAELAAAPPPAAALAELARLLDGRQPVGHGARLDVGVLRASGLWPEGREILDTLDISRILLPRASSHSLPALAARLGLAQPRPHRALDDADATRQLLLRLREMAAALEPALKAALIEQVAPYGWPLASFFAEALAQPGPRSARSPGSPAPPPPPRRPPDDDPASLMALLRPDGPLASLPGYEDREQQQQMLLAVAQIMRRGGRLVVEAGTGTGKSLAYLVPALARAVRHQERVVISTHTHTLQEQLLLKDIPALRRWLPWDFKASLLKGRSNYLSLRRWRRYSREPCRDQAELAFRLKILVWLAETETGDRSELRLQGPEEAYWALVSSDSLDCLGMHCTPENCFVHRSRAAAEEADLVVVNHALLTADAATGGALIPEYRHLVVDEAHHLEEAATQALRAEVDAREVAELLRALADGRGERSSGLVPLLRRQPHLGASAGYLAGAEEQVEAAAARCSALFAAVAAWVRGRLGEDREGALRLLPEHRKTREWWSLASSAEDAATALAALDATLRRAVAEGQLWVGDQPDQHLRELERVRAGLAEVGQLLTEAFVEPNSVRVYWFQVSPRDGSVALRAAPLDVAGLLRQEVIGDRWSAVFTSASLAVAGSFDYFCSRVGLGAEVETLLLPSPFNYLDQALVCLPTDVPDIGSEEFELAAVELIADVARRLGGRTLALFTSHQQLRDVYQGLKHRDDLDQVLILGQGLDGQRRQLLRLFEESPHPLLLGTSSFWEGVDIPGDRLSCVIIARLPFSVPTEPVFAARAERLHDPFLQYALPQAALRLKQGFGRLIRRGDDRGAVVILDRRILERDYGRAFLEALPPASRYIGPAAEIGERIEGWLAAGHTRSGA
jgi:predicted DnaQ family exonuclease/DinG family helicase